MERLHPTLWHMCRLLANAKRWRLLCALFERGAANTGSLAEQAGMSRPVASLYLHALESEGLIASERQGRFVVYAPRSNPKIPYAAPVVAALRDCCGEKVAFASVSKAATAFTHPRRIRIVKALGPGPLEAAVLSARTQVSPQALYRHLDKLAKRGIVVHDGGTIRLLEPTGGLAKALVAAVFVSEGYV
ncbi:helix-turn-helix domain-containing protein [Pontiella sp.]|uniref:helix-turn-helix domain-containing protein n=1 Tax=Pontiella sp. TaxID=2837462 RepID=UPI003568B1FF